jgi:hypothetical protein
MFDAYVIEVQGNTAGLIVRGPNEGDLYRFLPSSHAFNSLEALLFSSPLHAAKAAQDIARERPETIRPRMQTKLRIKAY